MWSVPRRRHPLLHYAQHPPQVRPPSTTSSPTTKVTPETPAKVVIEDSNPPFFKKHLNFITVIPFGIPS